MLTVKTYQISKKTGTLSNPQFAISDKSLGRVCATPTRQKLLQALPQDQHGTTWHHLFLQTKEAIFQTSIQCVHTVDGKNPAPDGKYPIIYRVLYILGGAGFLPSTVWLYVVHGAHRTVWGSLPILFNQHIAGLRSNRWTNIQASWWHFWLWRTSSLEKKMPRRLGYIGVVSVWYLSTYFAVIIFWRENMQIANIHLDDYYRLYVQNCTRYYYNQDMFNIYNIIFNIRTIQHRPPF